MDRQVYGEDLSIVYSMHSVITYSSEAVVIIMFDIYFVSHLIILLQPIYITVRFKLG